MAKTDQPSFFEKHIEKIAVLLAGGILVAVLVVVVVSSPHTMPIGAAAVPVPPGDIDEGLKELALQTQRGVTALRDDEPNMPQWSQAFWKRQRSPFPKALPIVPPDMQDLLVPFTDGRKLIEPTIKLKLTATRIPSLEPIPPLGRTYVRIDHELVRLPVVQGAADEAVATDLAAAHVTAVLDYGRMVDSWRKVFKKHALPLEPTFLRVLAERQELLADGSWSRATTIEGVRMMDEIFRGGSRDDSAALPPLPDPKVKDDLAFNREVEPFLAMGMQQAILAPEYYPVYWPGPRSWGGWMHHLPITAVNKLPSARVREDQLPSGAMDPSNWARARSATGPVRPTAAGRSRASRPRTHSRPTGTGGEGFGGEGMGGEGMPEGGPAGSPSYPTRARRPAGPSTDVTARTADRFVTEGYELLAAGNYEGAWNKFDRAQRVVPNHPDARQGKEAADRARYIASLPPITPVPELANQCQAGQVQLWLHDVTCQPGKTYRYRLKVVMLNPLFRQRQASKDDAEQMTLTAQSEFSAPTQTPLPSSLYAVGGNQSDGTVKFEVYRMAYGQQMRQTGSYAIGEQVGSVEPRSYVNPVDNQRSEGQTDVDFATGCIVVDARFGQKSVGGMNRSSIEVTLLRPDGTLVVRNDLSDGKDPQRRKLVDQAKQATELLEQAQTGIGGGMPRRPDMEGWGGPGTR